MRKKQQDAKLSARELQRVVNGLLKGYEKVPEAEKLTGLTGRQLRKLAEGERIDAIKIGVDWFIRIQSVEDYKLNKSPRGRKPKSELVLDK